MNGFGDRRGKLSTTRGLDHPRRILVIGGPCSGKTTLARKLGRQLNIPVYSMDYFMLPEITEGARQAIYDHILSQDAFIAEGIHYWPGALAKAECVVLLTPKPVVRTLRIVWARLFVAAFSGIASIARSIQRNLKTNRAYERTQLAKSLGFLGVDRDKILTAEGVNEAMVRFLSGLPQLPDQGRT